MNFVLVKGVQTISPGEWIPVNWYTQAAVVKAPACSPAGVPQPCSAGTTSRDKGGLCISHFQSFSAVRLLTRVR